MRKTVSATSNIQGDGPQNSSLSTNGRTSWTEEDDEQIVRKILQARNYVDLQELCRTCPECQRVAHHHKHKAPLMSMPTISADKPGRNMPSAAKGGRSVREPHPLPWPARLPDRTNSDS